DFGDGPRLLAGAEGTFSIGGVQCDLAWWDGARWIPIDPPADPISASGLKQFLSMGGESVTDSLWVTGAFGDGSLGSIRYYGVSPACAIADCDADGSTTFFDYLCFLNAYAAGDLGAADCDGDGSLAVLDFLCFQDAFAAGCP
ncbi:MAG: GC-type dockerin domain-anchored protein, partial [Phycisphaerales bacterium JB039]